MPQNSDFYFQPHFLTVDETPFTNKITPSLNDTVFNAVSSTSPFSYEQQQQHITELTRQMAHHKLFLNNNEGIFVNGSPHSTLCSFENSNCLNDSVLNLNSQRARFDLLRAAAELQKMHQVNNNEEEKEEEKEEEAFYGFTPDNHFGFHTQNHHQQQQHSLSLSHQKQLQIAQFETLKREQRLKQQEEFIRRLRVLQRESSNYQNVLRRGTNNETVFEGLSSSAWKNGNDNTNAVFIGNPNLKKERNGTGVFLPRFVDNNNNNNNIQSRKKPGSKNVVVPERVVHALNMKVDEGLIRGYMQRKNRFYGTSNVENGVGRIEGNNGFSQQKKNVNAQQQHVNHEIRLPPEWTY